MVDEEDKQGSEGQRRAGTKSNALVYGQILLYQTYFRARQSVETLADMIGTSLGHKPRVGAHAEPLFLFDRRFELQDCTTGEHEDSGGEYGAFLSRFKDIVWMTYRQGFIPMKPPSTYTTDTGWGCMLRSAQMLLAEVLMRHLGKGEWGQRNPGSNAHRNLLRWFIDAPKYFAFYSIHRMTECGRQYGKEPGEWYGPHTVALVLRDLVASHGLRRPSSKSFGNGESVEVPQPKFLEKDYYSIFSEAGQDIAVLVSDDGTLYLDEVDAACKVFVTDNEDASKNDDAKNDNINDTNDPLLRPKKEPVWKSALFLIVPLRLGLNELNKEYIQPLIQALKFPQCVGMIGGKPAHSLYFVGSQGTDFIYLDPHTVQDAATNAECDDEFFPYQGVVDTYHCSQPRLTPIASIDPCLAIGFYCKTASEFSNLVVRLTQLQHVGLPILGIMQTRPVYDDSSDDGGGSHFDDDDDDDDAVDVVADIANSMQKPLLYDGELEQQDEDDEGMETASEGGQDTPPSATKKTKATHDDDEDDFVLL